MHNFYLFKSGTLKQKDYSLVLESDEKDFLIPIEQVDAIYCFGEITLNKRLLELLNQYSIELIFYSYYGDLIGRFCPNQPGSGEVFMKQVDFYRLPEKRLLIAKAMEQASLHNSLAVLKDYHKNGHALETQIEGIRTVLEKIPEAQSVEELLLLEARGKKIYYSGFDVILYSTGFTFGHRTTHPPKNAVNSMMSFGYHLLYGEVLKEIDRSRLYPEVAFIHSNIGKGASLHYDLADIYKPFLIDRMILRLIRLRQITLDNFEERNDGIYLKKDSQKRFVSEFNTDLLKTVHYGNRSMSHQSIIRRDLHKLIDFLEGKSSVLCFYLFKW